MRKSRRQRWSFQLLLRAFLGILLLAYAYLNLVVNVSSHEAPDTSSVPAQRGKSAVTHVNLPDRRARGLDSSSQSRKLKLQEKLDAILEKTGQPYDDDLWELSDYIPPWMKEYFRWHRVERAKLSPESFDEDSPTYNEGPKLLVMQCLKGMDDRCGGTADRLKPFLFILREAYESKRLLLIHWTLPARLEEFLLPPPNGIDWRAPPWLSELLHDKSLLPGRKIFKLRAMKGARTDQTSRLFRTRLQSATGGAEYYNEELATVANTTGLVVNTEKEATFEEVYHDVWRVFFTPSPTVRASVDSYMEQWNLVPGQYAAAHLRALYGRVSDRPEAQAREWTRNALNCASKLRPGGPFLFASDHSFSIQAALEYGEEMHAKVVARPHDSEPLHLDNAENIGERLPHEFYDVFIDLYLMGMSRCLTYNRGGFGQWALLIGYNATCGYNQKTSKYGIKTPCTWTEATTTVKGLK